LQHNFKESQERLVKLPEDEPAVFELYMQWLYTAQIFPHLLHASTQCLEDTCKLGSPLYIALAKAYVLGETLQDDHFKDTILDAIISLFVQPARVWAPEATSIIYAGTAPGSSARKLMVDLYTYSSRSAWFSEHAQQHHPEDFLHDLCLSWAKQKEGLLNPSAAFQSHACVYHSHWGKGKVCYKTEKLTEVLAKPPPHTVRRSSGSVSMSRLGML